VSATIAIAVAAVVIWAYLLCLRGGFWRMKIEAAPAAPAAWADVAVVVPARDEAESVGAAIRSLLAQRYDGGLTVILVDDHSGDGTAGIARQAALDRAGAFHVVAARDLPPGWTGKLWAMNEGIAAAARLAPSARYLLLTDADIVHAPDNLARLVARAEARGLDLASLMVRLACDHPVERALIPAFVFFFAMLCPFEWVNRREWRTAAAAGGSMLVRRAALERIGGIAAIRDRLIDDCALAQAIKPDGPIWLGLTDDAVSLRRYRHGRDVWRMITRTAFTQLGYSSWALFGTIVAMAVTYLAPPLLALFGHGWAVGLGLVAWAGMAVAYLPLLRFYRCSILWAPLLPLIALFYLAATIDSARLHWLGRGGQWKGRAQSRMVTGKGS